jgi:hypothetical protein
VIQHVREKFTCRDCEKISQAPAPFHVIARGWAGPSLLGMVLFEKFGQHQPLNRQAERYAKEGVPIVHLPPSMQKTGISAPMMPPSCAATKSDGASPTFHGAASIQCRALHRWSGSAEHRYAQPGQHRYRLTPLISPHTAQA